MISNTVEPALGRFERLLAEAFVDESAGPLRLVRTDELMRRWRAAYLRRVEPETHSNSKLPRSIDA